MVKNKKNLIKFSENNKITLMTAWRIVCTSDWNSRRKMQQRFHLRSHPRTLPLILEFHSASHWQWKVSFNRAKVKDTWEKWPAVWSRLFLNRSCIRLLKSPVFRTGFLYVFNLFIAARSNMSAKNALSKRYPHIFLYPKLSRKI